MENNILKTAVIDRFWHHQLLVPMEKVSDDFLKYLRLHSLIAIETGGASGFHSRIVNNNILYGRLYIFNSQDYSRLKEVFNDALEDELDNLLKSKTIQSALRIYKSRSGIFADDERKMLSYLIRMIEFTVLTDGDYLASPERLEVAEAVFSYYDIKIKKAKKDSIITLTMSNNLPFLSPIGESGLTINTIISETMHQNNTAKNDLSKENEKGRHVFISYSHDDRDNVLKLRTSILNAGYNVWWDEEIVPGQNWKLEINKAINGAFAIVVCFSANMLGKNKSGMYPEIYDAIDMYRTMRPGSIFIIPVRFSPCNIPPIAISDNSTINNLQYIDLFYDQNSQNHDESRFIKAIHFAYENVN